MNEDLELPSGKPAAAERPGADGEAETLLGSEMTANLAGVPVPRFSLVEAAGRERVFKALFDASSQSIEMGRYVVTGMLGRGGMGTVFKAFDRTLDRRVALKVLHKELDEKHTIRLLREAQALAKLSHPNVVQVYEVGEFEGQTFVAMELVKGQTLNAWMRQEPRPGWRECVEVFVQVGKGLAAAHARGLVHRDFKPGNAIIDRKGRACVLDFGLARKVEWIDDDQTTASRAITDKQAPVPLDVSLTNTGAVLGTPAYMPPEQMGEHEADARSDQFSFCVALYEAVYGERPYEGNTLPALLMSMTHGDVRPVPKGTKVPGTLRRVLLRGLAKDPAQRWPSMETLLAQLRRLVAPRRRPWLALGVIGGLVATGAGLGLGQYAEVMNRCTGAVAQLEGVWDEARKQEVKAAILGTKLSYSLGTWERVEQRLDTYTKDWANKHIEVCEATRVTEEQTEEEMGLRMGCLRERMTALRATVKTLGEADAQVVEKAIKVVYGMPGLSSCDDLGALMAAVPPPDDPQVAQEVEALRERLAEIKVAQEAGKYSPALQQVETVVQRAEALGYMPLVAEATLRRGRLRGTQGEYAKAEQDLRKAYTPQRCIRGRALGRSSGVT